MRVGRDSLRNYDACFLCLNTAREPMACNQGHMACKECFYENIVAQRKAIQRDQKLRERQLAVQAVCGPTCMQRARVLILV